MHHNPRNRTRVSPIGGSVNMIEIIIVGGVAFGVGRVYQAFKRKR